LEIIQITHIIPKIPIERSELIFNGIGNEGMAKWFDSE
jgi:hypothetical protein